MSAKRGRRAKPQKPKTQEGPAMEDMDSPNLSAIERASFMEGLPQSFGNPLHSTAVEEDLNVSENQEKEDRKAEGKHPPKTSKTLVKQSGDAVKRKNTERDAESEEEQKKKKRSRRSTVETVTAGPKKDEEPEKKKRKRKGARHEQREKPNTDEVESDAGDIPKTPAASSVRRLVTKKPANRRRSVQTSAARKVKNQQVKKDGDKSEGGKSEDSGPQEELDADTIQQRRRKVPSSDEDVTDEDTSWNPSQKEMQGKRNSSGKNTKSSLQSTKSGTPSSDNPSEDSDEDDTDKQRSKKQGSRSATELEVVLDTFTDFCEQYRESVKSDAFKQSIKSFSTVVKQQLMEKISSQKELKALKRENAKVGCMIHKKTQRLLDAKQEMMTAERKVMSLKKEKSELKHRLADLRRGQAFLHDLRELNRLYLDYRNEHPKKKETYGPSSLPALQLETKQIKAVEQKHERKSNQLRKGQKMNRVKK